MTKSAIYTVVVLARRCAGLKPAYLAIGGMLLTITNMLIGNLLVIDIPPGAVRTGLLGLLIGLTMSAPPASLGILLTHYRTSSKTLPGIVMLYASLIMICANINLDMMIHFSRPEMSPFHGMATMWDFAASGAMSINWPRFFATVVDCIHFSIETLSTVGYGDIVPATWYSKLAVDIEALMGLGITVLAVGTYFSARQWAPNGAAVARTLSGPAFCPHCGDAVGSLNRTVAEHSHTMGARNQSRG